MLWSAKAGCEGEGNRVVVAVVVVCSAAVVIQGFNSIIRAIRLSSGQFHCSCVHELNGLNRCTRTTMYLGISALGGRRGIRASSASKQIQHQDALVRNGRPPVNFGHWPFDNFSLRCCRPILPY